MLGRYGPQPPPTPATRIGASHPEIDPGWQRGVGQTVDEVMP